MFAGAAREAVFAQPEVIRRVNAQFIPVALKAGMVNNPPGGVEGALYREIGRSKPAPQGICVVNSAGKVLDWVLMFDDDASVSGFLDHAAKRFARYPGAKEHVAAERFMKYPSQKLSDVADSEVVPAITARHALGTRCPATPPVEQGTILARVFGRALDANGKPVADTVRQEHYVEDQFRVPPALQAELAKALAAAGNDRFPLADDLARLLVGHAYLGQLDVNPLGAPGGSGDLKSSAFTAQRVGLPSGDPTWIRIEGKSEAEGASHGEGNDGRLWQHEVKLAWDGMIQVTDMRISRLLLTAHGSEKLMWANDFALFQGDRDVAHLPGGHPFDLKTQVRYGIIGEPIAGEAANAAQPAEAEAQAQVPEEARRQLAEAFGPPFRVFLEKVQVELKLSDEQKEKLERQCLSTIQDAMQFFGKLEGVKPEERGKEMQAQRQKQQEQLAAFLKDTLKPEQLKRLRQLELQEEGLFALGRPEIMAEMKLSDEQRQRFMMLVQELQAKVEPLVKEAQSGGNPETIRPKVMAMRKEYSQKIEAILTPAQTEQWQKMLGKPFKLDD